MRSDSSYAVFWLVVALIFVAIGAINVAIDAKPFLKYCYFVMAALYLVNAWFSWRCSRTERAS